MLANLLFWGPRSFQFDLEMNINIYCMHYIIPKKFLTLGLCLEYETFIRGVFCPNLCVCLCVCVCVRFFFDKNK